jgi:FtsZ-interacting cell division protein ZipA
MSPTITIVLIIVVLVIIAAIVYGVQTGRRKKLQSTFGPEYDRVVADTGNRTEAEKELREREKRHAELELKELSPESQQRYRAAWEEVQIQFVDNPSEAVGTADELVTRLITERGYPTAEYDEQLATLSVAHANTLQHYREAHEISERNAAGSASTEDLRQALVHYRALFGDLLGTDPVSTNPGTTTSNPDDEPPAPAPRRAADDTDAATDNRR